MPTMDLYYFNPSPPCRAVHLTGEALGIKFNFIETSPLSGDTKKPEFKEINFMTTVPTIVDDGFTLWESRSIMQYLADKYGKYDNLYPKNAKQRAKVDRLLYFDMSLMNNVSQYVVPVLLSGKKREPEKLVKLEEGLEQLNIFLEGKFFAAGNKITIADHSLMITVHFAHTVASVQLKRFPNVDHWYTRCRHQIANFDKINQEAEELFKKLAHGKFRA